jgi:hypothetical protein
MLKSTFIIKVINFELVAFTLNNLLNQLLKVGSV